MTRTKILTQPARIEDVAFEDFYDSISQDWEDKARRLQARRWRKLKHQEL